jgi:hypothetical protein
MKPAQRAPQAECFNKSKTSTLSSNAQQLLWKQDESTTKSMK